MATSRDLEATVSDKQYSIDFINLHLNDGINSLGTARTLHEKASAQKISLEKQLSLASCEVPSQIENAVRRAEDTQKRIVELGTKQEMLHHDVMDFIRDMGSQMEEVKTKVDKVMELDKYRRYLAHLVYIDSLSSDIQTGLLTDDIQQSVDVFQSVTNLYTDLQKSSCFNLLKYLSHTIVFWYTILLDKLSCEFEKVLTEVRWPLIATVIKPPSTTNPTILFNKLSLLFTQLLQIQLPENFTPTDGAPEHGDSILPLEQMVKPLCKRFKYHFYGNKPTNNIEKPEWYFTQVVTWMRDHGDFLDTHIQPLLNTHTSPIANAKIELARSLVKLVIDKVTVDLPEFLKNDAAFAHLIDESLLFDLDLHSNHGYPTYFPGILHVLCLPDAFDKWKNLEKKFAVEKIDSLLTSPDAWTSQYKDVTGIHNLHVPQCTDVLISLVHTITERYECLPDPQCRLDFLDLQLDLLDDFRIRLLQIMKTESQSPLNHGYLSILNAVYYICEVLSEWNEKVFFVQLQYERTRQDELCATALESQMSGEMSFDVSNSSNITNYLSFSEQPSPTKADYGDILQDVQGAVFDDVIGLLERTKADMLNTIVNCVFMDIKAMSQPYRRDKWISLPSQKDPHNLALSTTAYDMLMVLRYHVNSVEGLLSPPLFTLFWQQLARELDNFVYTQVILCNKFNEGGAAQLQFDMNRNLFSLFAQFTDKPHVYFRRVSEACHVLNLSVGSAILLKDVLYTCLHPDLTSSPSDKTPDLHSALHELSIFTLSGEDTEMVLSLRTNLFL